MICHEHKCIFIHQRKCAGTSIIRAFGIEPASPEWNFANEGTLGRHFRHKPDGYLVFSVVRNPWDRFVSGWKYLASTKNRSLREVLDDLPTQGHDYRHLTRPQSAILLDSEKKPVWDCLLRFETLQADFDALCDRLGKQRVTLPLSKRSDREHYTTYYEPDTAEAVASLFREDIDRFGYRFGD